MPTASFHSALAALSPNPRLAVEAAARAVLLRLVAYDPSRRNRNGYYLRYDLSTPANSPQNLTEFLCKPRSKSLMKTYINTAANPWSPNSKRASMSNSSKHFAMTRDPPSFWPPSRSLYVLFGSGWRERLP